MKFLTVFNAALAALCLTMALVQGVVCLLYAFALDEAPRLGADLPLLLGSTAVFALLGLLFAAGFVGLLRNKPWRWPMQGAIALSLLPAALAVYGLLT